MIKNLAELDALVEIEHKKHKYSDFGFSFYKNHRPGEGHFLVSCKFNSAQLEYRREVNKENVSLLRDGDSIVVRIDEGLVQSVSINERYYTNPETSVLKEFKSALGIQENEDIDSEKRQVIKFGEHAYSAALKYLKTRIPDAINLIEGYFSRSLLPPESQPALRTNEEILARFNLHIPD